MSATNLTRSMIGQWLFLDGVPTKPAAYWVALFQNYTPPDDTGLNGFEIPTSILGVPTGYGRVAYAPGGARFAENPSVPGQFYNLQAIQFGAPALQWPAITNFALMNAETGGIALARGALSVPLVVTQGGQAAIFEPGGVVLNVV